MTMISFEVLVFLIGKRSVLCSQPFRSEGLDLGLVHSDFLRLESKGLNEVEVGISGKSSEDPEKWLLVLVVRFG